MRKLIVRKAKAGDEGQVLSLVKEVLSEYGLEINPEEEDLDITDIQKYYMDNEGDFEVIEFAGNIIGSYGVFKVDENTCELRKMYLHKDFQGLGLGNIMIENSIKIAIALGYKKITLQTNSLLYKAISLYEKYGFEEFKEEVFEKCDLAMVRKIA